MIRIIWSLIDYSLHQDRNLDTTLHCTHSRRQSKISAPDKMNALLFTCKKCQVFEGRIRTVLDQGNKNITASSLVCAGTTSKDFSWDWTYSLCFSVLGLNTNFFFVCSRQWPQKRISSFKHHLALASYSPWARKQHDLNGLRRTPHTWEHVPRFFRHTERSTSWEGHSAQ